MQIISFNMIIDLNNILKEKSLDFKIHLRDRCGSQSMWIEALSSNVSINSRDELDILINDYFAKQHISLKFSDDCNSFWAVSLK